jgi:hypothetical protein
MIIPLSGVARAAEVATEPCDGGPLMTKPFGPRAAIRILLANHAANHTSRPLQRRSYG